MSMLTKALTYSAIGGLLGFSVGVVQGVLQAPSDGTIPEIDVLTNKLYPFVGSEATTKVSADLYALFHLQDELSLQSPRQAFELKNAIDQTLNAAAPADEDEHVQALFAEVSEFAAGLVQNITMDVDANMM